LKARRAERPANEIQDVFRVGDCKAPAQLNRATWDAHRLQREFAPPSGANPSRRSRRRANKPLRRKVVHPSLPPDPDFDDNVEHVDERAVVLHKALGLDAPCFDYVYDFGDDWHHVVVLEDQHVDPKPPASIHCIDGENACPPEDVGGAFRFDLRHFDLDAANRALSKIKT
jgi:Plasmid pRiA4b ORF-3-like protein